MGVTGHFAQHENVKKEEKTWSYRIDFKRSWMCIFLSLFVCLFVALMGSHFVSTFLSSGSVPILFCGGFFPPLMSINELKVSGSDRISKWNKKKQQKRIKLFFFCLAVSWRLAHENKNKKVQTKKFFLKRHEIET